MSLFYVVVLGTIGVLMVIESVRAILRRRAHRRRAQAARAYLGAWPAAEDAVPQVAALYLASSRRSLVGFAIGVLSAVMGVGGGFMLVPAMIYLLGMPTSVVIGTSLFQMVFVAANVTLLQAVQLGTVDILLAMLLLVGGVAGAQFGAAMGTKLRGEETRALLGLLVLAVALSLLWGLLRPPGNLFSAGPAL